MGRLIAVLTCHRFRARADVLRRTWAQNVENFDVKFFLGNGGEGQPQADEIWLDCPDDYPNLRLKTQLAFGWAVAHGYDFVFKTDDDVYVIPERLHQSFMGRDYSGRVRGPSCENDAPRIYGSTESNFCSGFGYWLSKGAAKIVAEAPDNGDWAEDRFAGNALARVGIRPVNDPAILLWPPLSGHFCSRPNQQCNYCVSQYYRASVICPYARPEVIEELHRYYVNTRFIPTWLA